MYKCPHCGSTELTILSVVPHSLNDEDYEFMHDLRHTDFPLYWVYGVLFWMEETNKFYWNENVLTAIYNYNDPGNSIEKMFSDLSIIPPDYLETLKKLPSPDVNRGYGIDDNDSKLFKDIKQW